MAVSARLRTVFVRYIPSIDNRTNVLILQHQQERAHPFNSARTVGRALNNSRLIYGRNEYLAQLDLPIQPGAGLLFPGRGATLLSEANPLPSQIVIIDGTWHHAKTLFRDVPVLQTLPRYSLAPNAPGEYRIRLEPTDTSLSTLEATVQALQILEPETPGLEQLMESFHKMVDIQLAHPNANYSGETLASRKQSRPNVPYVLVYDLENIVIAYGESVGRERETGQTRRLPVYWVAENLGSGEVFSAMIHHDDGRILAEVFEHLELLAYEMPALISLDEFRSRWNMFVGPGQTLAVYNQGTIRMLENVQAVAQPNLVLKCVS